MSGISIGGPPSGAALASQLAGQTIPGALTINGAAAVTGGALFIEDGSNTSITTPAVLTPTNVNGTAAQLTDTSKDYMVYLTVGTAGTALTINIGPTAGVADTIYNAATATAGQTINFRLPAGWFWKWAATTATLALQSAIGC